MYNTCWAILEYQIVASLTMEHLRIICPHLFTNLFYISNKYQTTKWVLQFWHVQQTKTIGCKSSNIPVYRNEFVYIYKY